MYLCGERDLLLDLYIVLIVMRFNSFKWWKINFIMEYKIFVLVFLVIILWGYKYVWLWLFRIYVGLIRVMNFFFNSLLIEILFRNKVIVEVCLWYNFGYLWVMGW